MQVKSFDDAGANEKSPKFSRLQNEPNPESGSSLLSVSVSVADILLFWL
jgi:hypothetical protein